MKQLFLKRGLSWYVGSFSQSAFLSILAPAQRFRGAQNLVPAFQILSEPILAAYNFAPEPFRVHPNDILLRDCIM